MKIGYENHILSHLWKSPCLITGLIFKFLKYDTLSIKQIDFTKSKERKFSFSFDGCVQFLWSQNFVNACLCSRLMPFLEFLWPCYAFLLIDLINKFDGHVMKATKSLIIHSTLLIGLWHHVFEASALEHLLQPQVLTIDLLFQSCG